jgi:hypothetical protein
MLCEIIDPVHDEGDDERCKDFVSDHLGKRVYMSGHCVGWFKYVI